MKRIVSFSLFGTAPLYQLGALRNVCLVPKVYPGWTARVYASQEVPEAFVTQLRNEGAEVVLKQRTALIDGMFWRFLPAGETDIDAMVVRDTDSRPTPREFAAVEEWLESGMALHILRDHPLHRIAIPGGMWGCRGGAIPEMADEIRRWGLWHKKGHDQDFLRERIYQRFKDDCLVHSDFFAFGDETVLPFPMARDRGEFVGCVYQPDRDTLTLEQHAENQPIFDQVRLQRLPPARRKPKAYLVCEQWVRSLRRRAG